MYQFRRGERISWQRSLAIFIVGLIMGSLGVWWASSDAGAATLRSDRDTAFIAMLTGLGRQSPRVNSTPSVRPLMRAPTVRCSPCRGP
jgi:hypothetical protein